MRNGIIATIQTPFARVGFDSNRSGIGIKGDEPARSFIMEQDREIAEKGGRPALSIKRIERVGAKNK
jgi:hypothetical protein